MTSSATTLGFNKQGPGDNANAWGDVLNAQVFDLVDEAIRGVYSATLSGAHTLDATNYVGNEARRAILSVTGGTGGTITLPNFSKLYAVRNGASGDVILTTGGTTNATVKPGEACLVMSDGVNVYRIAPFDFGGHVAQNLADPSGDQDAATKKYVDATAFDMASGELPGQTGNAGKALTTDGSAASWGDSFTDWTLTTPTIAAPTVTDGATVSGGLALSGGLSLTGSTEQNVVAVSALDIDLSQGEFFTKAISAASTFTFSNATASKAQAFALDLTISSSAVPTWPAAVKWAGGSAPSLADGTHVLGFLTFDGGTNWIGVLAAYGVS